MTFRNPFAKPVQDFGVDLGNAFVRAVQGDGAVISEERSCVAYKSAEQRMVACGDSAYEMLGKTPEGVVACSPFREGNLADELVAEELLRQVFASAGVEGSKVPLLILGVSSLITPLEKRALRAAAQAAGAREVRFLNEALAAAIGAGLPIQEAAANFIVDFGASCVEITLISLSGIVYARRCLRGGQRFDRTLVDFMRRSHHLVIGPRTAEEIKTRLAAAPECKSSDASMEVSGRDLISGLPHVVFLNRQDVIDALTRDFVEIANTITASLAHCPPELSSDLVDRGLVVVGGGATIPGLADYLRKQTGLPVHIAERPAQAAAEGIGRVLGDLNNLRGLLDAELSVRGTLR